MIFIKKLNLTSPPPVWASKSSYSQVHLQDKAKTNHKSYFVSKGFKGL